MVFNQAQLLILFRPASQELLKHLSLSLCGLDLTPEAATSCTVLAVTLCDVIPSSVYLAAPDIILSAVPLKKTKQ